MLHKFSLLKPAWLVTYKDCLAFEHSVLGVMTHVKADNHACHAKASKGMQRVLKVLRLIEGRGTVCRAEIAQLHTEGPVPRRPQSSSWSARRPGSAYAAEPSRRGCLQQGAEEGWAPHPSELLCYLQDKA